MNVKLIAIKSPSGACRFLGKTGTLNINNGTFMFVADNGTFFNGNIVSKKLSHTAIEIETESNIFTFEIL